MVQNTECRRAERRCDVAPVHMCIRSCTRVVQACVRWITSRAGVHSPVGTSHPPVPPSGFAPFACPGARALRASGRTPPQIERTSRRVCPLGRVVAAAPPTQGLRAARLRLAGQCGLPRREPLRCLDKGGATASAPIQQRLGAVFAVAVQPAHHRLRVAAGACRDMRRTGTLCDVVEGEEPLAAAGVRGSQGQAAQLRQRLAPALMVDSQHQSGQGLSGRS